MRIGERSLSFKQKSLNGPMAQSLNLLAGACQFTGMVLGLTILLIFLSINNLKDHFDPADRSPA